MVNLVLEYIKYRLNRFSKGQNPSEFQKKFTEKCLLGKMEPSDEAKMEQLFSKLKNDNRVIEIQDFGAGSKKLGNQRAIKTILKTSSSQGKYGEVLYSIAKNFKSDTILEFGTSLGIGTNYFALGNPKSSITTVEACPNTRKIALENLPENMKSVESTFDDYINQLTDEKFDIIFIDGHHDGTALLDYLERLIPYSTPETIFILDDIRWSDSMLNAWKKILKSGDFEESVDLFRVGVVCNSK